MVGEPGFEPGTSCTQGRRAAELRYSPFGRRAGVVRYCKAQSLKAGALPSCATPRCGIGRGVALIRKRRRADFSIAGGLAEGQGAPGMGRAPLDRQPYTHYRILRICIA